MPKVKDFMRIIPKIYRRNYEDVAMYFFVEAQRQIVPAVTVEQSLYNYFRFIGVNEFNIESAISTYSTLKRDFYENSKTNS